MTSEALCIALRERLEIDLYAAGVERGVGAIDADEGREAFHRRIFEDNVGKGLLVHGHGGEGCVLGAFGNAENDAGVLNGEKSFWNVDVEQDGADEGANGDEKCDFAVLQDKFQRAPVKGNDGIKSMLRFAVEPTLVFFLLMAKKFGAHHGGESKRDEGGDENGDGESDGEFTEEPADDVGHEKKGNEHGDERNGERYNRKPNLFRTFQGCLERRFAFFNVTADIFDHDDGIVDDETGGDGEGHEGKVVKAVVEEIHHAERADDGEGYGQGGNDGGAKTSQKKEDDHDHQADGEYQGELDVFDGSTNCGGAVGENFDLHRSRERSLKLRK